MPDYGDFFVIAIEPKAKHILIRYFVVLAYKKSAYFKERCKLVKYLLSY